MSTLKFLGRATVTLFSQAVDDVLDERTRQIEAEGFNSQHDDEHEAGELAAAASAYALNAADQLHPFSQGDGNNEQPIMWPWAPEWWKPKDPRRDLVRAAALIIAEIERIDRQPMSGPTEWHRDNDQTFLALLLVSGHEVTPEAIASWTDEQCRQAQEWAIAAHLHASDHDDIEVPPIPACVQAYMREVP